MLFVNNLQRKESKRTTPNLIKKNKNKVIIVLTLLIVKERKFLGSLMQK